MPKRQIEEINGNEEIIYNLNAGSGINRKPYTTDEYQLYINEYVRIDKLQAEIDKKLKNQ